MFQQEGKQFGFLQKNNHNKTATLFVTAFHKDSVSYLNNFDLNEHNKDMKKFFLIVCCVCFCFLAVGCESETNINAAHISDITGALSTNYAVKVVLDDDERVNDKYVDLQIKSSKDEQLLKFGEELGEAYVVCLPKSDYWYNLTYLTSKTNGATAEGGYQKYEDFGSKVFNFTSPNDVELTFRVVAGQTKLNEQTKEEILVLSEEISKEVTLKVKKFKED